MPVFPAILLFLPVFVILICPKCTAYAELHFCCFRSAVLQQSFRFAVFPKQYITFNPMQYVIMRHKKDDMDLFVEETDTDNGKVKPLSFERYQKLTAQLGKRSKDAILPV